MRYLCLFALLFCCGSINAASTNISPNILFAIADDASWPHFSAYGCKFVNTPNFDRIAREGVLFNNFFTPIPKCSPSRASILTGRDPWQLEDAFDHYGIFPAKFKVYPDLLEHQGYFVGFTGKGWAPGDWRKGGFARNPAGPEYNRLALKPPTTGIQPIDYAGNFAEFLKARPAGKPFCFWYGGREPHRPYEDGSGVRFGKHLDDLKAPPFLPDDKIVRSDLLDYAVEIEWFDAQLGKMLKMLEDAHELDNTIVIVTSDNGLPFPRGKGQICEDACHLPLAIRWPGVAKAGLVVDDIARSTDFAPTFLQAAGLAPLAEMTGGPLQNLLEGKSDPSRDYVLLGRERTDLGRPGDVGYPVRSIRTRDYLYTRNFAPDRWPSGNPETDYPDIDASPSKSDVLKLKDRDPLYYNLAMAKRGPEELYDLRHDPDTVHNLADDPAYAQIKSTLWNTLQTKLRAENDPRMFGQGDVFDHYEWTANRKHAWDTVVGQKKPQ